MKNKSEDEMRSLLSSLPVERVQQISEALDWARNEEEKQWLEESTQKKEAQVLGCAGGRWEDEWRAGEECFE